MLSIMEFDGIDTSGTNGSGAIAQSKSTGAFPSATASTTLDSAPAGTSATYGAAQFNVGTSTTSPGTGFTEVHEQSSVGKLVDMETEWRADAVQTISATNTLSANNSMSGIEIKAAAAAAAVPGHGALLSGIRNQVIQRV